MNAKPARPTRPDNDGLHPLVYQLVIGLTAWFVLSAWAFFDRGNYVTLTLAVITVFFVIVTGIPTMIWLVWRHHAAPEDRPSLGETFRQWNSEKFATWTGALSGRAAAVQVLLPIAAVAIGMTVIGLVFYFDVPGVVS